MRIAAAILVAVHVLGHIVWFMATWAQWSLGGSGRSELIKGSTKKTVFVLCFNLYRGGDHSTAQRMTA